MEGKENKKVAIEDDFDGELKRIKKVQKKLKKTKEKIPENFFDYLEQLKKYSTQKK